jgi:hypothetical protein
VNSANGEEEETGNAEDGGSEGSASSDDLIADEETQENTEDIGASHGSTLETLYSGCGAIRKTGLLGVKCGRESQIRY